MGMELEDAWYLSLGVPLMGVLAFIVSNVVEISLQDDLCNFQRNNLQAHADHAKTPHCKVTQMH
jgi:hypothetical protein